MMQVSEGYSAIHGLPEGTVESTRSEWKSRAHPGDLARIEALRHQAFQERRGEYNAEYRIVRPTVRFDGSNRAVSFLTTVTGAPNG